MKNIYFIYNDETKIIIHASFERADIIKVYDGYTLDEQVFEYQMAHYWVGDDVSNLKPYLDSIKITDLVTSFKPLDQHRYKLFYSKEQQFYEIICASKHGLNVKELVLVDTISDLMLYRRIPSKPFFKKLSSLCYVQDSFNQGAFKEVFLITTDKQAAMRYCKSRGEILTVSPEAIQIEDLHIVISGRSALEVEPEEPIQDELLTAVSLLESIVECPRSADESTRRDYFNIDSEEHRKALIVNFSCSYEKIHLIQEFLNNNK